MGKILSKMEREYILTKINSRVWGDKNRTYKKRIERKIKRFDSYLNDILIIIKYSKDQKLKENLAETFFKLFFENKQASQKAKNLVKDTVNESFSHYSEYVRDAEVASKQLLKNMNKLKFTEKAGLLDELYATLGPDFPLVLKGMRPSKRERLINPIIETLISIRKIKRTKRIIILEGIKTKKLYDSKFMNRTGFSDNSIARWCRILKKEGLIEEGLLPFSWELTEYGNKIYDMIKR